jgi:predicted phosphohydrolase
MTIQYCSYLHLELPENAKWLKANPIVPAADILVWAGDIIPFVEMDQCTDFFSFLSDHFQATYWLPGNHEYYGGDIMQRNGSFREAIRSNVYLLNNQVEQLEGVTLIFSTPINAWIYGHHHSNTLEFMIGNTRMLANQLGYVRKREYYGFKNDEMITL